MFNTNIQVELDSSWKKIFEEVKLQVQSKEVEVENLKGEDNNDRTEI